MEDPHSLLLEIAHCQIAKDIRSGSLRDHCCRTIVKSQTGLAFQLPEPWAGQIEHAPILFISSNPSFDEEEEFPSDSVKDWPEARVVDFFKNRFTSPAGWVKNLGVLHRDGTYSRWVQFWASARARTCELLRKNKDAVELGRDFALTEIVHCKSRGEVGVREARAFCPKRYLDRVLFVSGAKILVVFGSKAQGAICDHLDVHDKKEMAELFGSARAIAGQRRMVAFLPHPNARKVKKTLEANLGSRRLADLRSYLEKGRQA